MKAIDIRHAEIGTVSSRADGSVAFRVITPELRPSEAGVVVGWHGKAARVTITPDEDAVPDDVLEVATDREIKTHSKRIRSVLYIAWCQGLDVREGEEFEYFYKRQCEKFIDWWKKKLND